MNSTKLISTVVELRSNLNKLACEPKNLEKADEIFQLERKLGNLHLALLKKQIKDNSDVLKKLNEGINKINDKLKLSLNEIGKITEFISISSGILDNLTQIVLAII